MECGAALAAFGTASNKTVSTIFCFVVCLVGRCVLGVWERTSLQDEEEQEDAEEDEDTGDNPTAPTAECAAVPTTLKSWIAVYYLAL